MQKQNPLLRIWGWGKNEHGRLIGAVISALIAVLLGMLPYFAAAQVIIGMLAGEKDLSFYLPWLGLGLAGYAARTLLYNMALSMSHKATFSILKNIRKKILEKLPKLPLGTVMDMSSGKMKQIIVDQVDGMETTLAHLFPEPDRQYCGAAFYCGLPVCSGLAHGAFVHRDAPGWDGIYDVGHGELCEEL